MFALKDRTSFQAWKAVELDNPVAQDLTRAAMWVQQVCDGSRPVAYLCGTAGVGKTWAVQQGVKIAASQGIEPVYCNPANYREMVEAYDVAGGTRPVIFEEADQVFGSERMLNIAKLASDPAGPRTHAGNGKRLIGLGAPTFYTTNLNLGDDKLFPLKLRPHIQALRSRAVPLVISAERLSLWEYSCYLAIIKNLSRHNTRGEGIPLRIQNMALAWFTQNLWRLDEVSPRRLREIARGIDRYWDRTRGAWVPNGEAAWAADLQAFLALPAQGNPVPSIPRIYLTTERCEAA